MKELQVEFLLVNYFAIERSNTDRGMTKLMKRHWQAFSHIGQTAGLGKGVKLGGNGNNFEMFSEHKMIKTLKCKGIKTNYYSPTVVKPACSNVYMF
ncbi:hypothetical protein A2V95_02190 [Candidatus Kuenenbacteria bacterium RBG_16_41_7]|uniref:Uncharacterized protein n=1 Tax=Candidatus Kuenenbacteria bacterium RBG_16_41_7 TaxID=1798560 RepID=A0A1F6GCD7_9BACT|nr:MAG: hypothetical protein A2V95_02190 [Candidatus Kuenenbacteria bacterium RBG_16_41_7]